MTRRRSLLLQAAAGGGPTFFGNYSMLREFWAEDPSWTNPGAGGTITTWRDNGTLASDVSAVTVGGGAAPTYEAALINGKPGLDFSATSASVGGGLATVNGVNGADLTVGCVARFDSNSWIAYAMDGRSSPSERAIIGDLTSSWRGYASSSLNVAAGTPDTADHVFVLRATTNDLELYVDGVSIGTDTSGTLAFFNGVTIGIVQGINNQCMNGAISYAFMYSGDLTAQAGYSTWLSGIQTYYGI